MRPAAVAIAVATIAAFAGFGYIAIGGGAGPTAPPPPPRALVWSATARPLPTAGTSKRTTAAPSAAPSADTAPSSSADATAKPTAADSDGALRSFSRAGPQWAVEFHYNANDHPSCAAHALLHRYANAEDTAPTTEPLAAFRTTPRWYCYKHGGYYKPGIQRRILLPPIPRFAGQELNATDMSPVTAGTPREPLWAEQSITHRLFTRIAGAQRRGSGAPAAPTRITLRRVVWLNQRLHSCSVPPGEKVKLPLAGAYTMVTGNWPQSLYTEVELHGMPQALVLKGVCEQPERTDAAVDDDASTTTASFLKKCVERQRADPTVRCAALGYHQLPTDFISSYHVVAEVLLDMFSAVTAWRSMASAALRSVAAGARSGKATGATSARGKGLPALEPGLVLTQRPTYSRHGFKANSCKHGASKCLTTAWARLYRWAFERALGQPAAGAEAITKRGSFADAGGDGREWIVGLAESQQEAARGPVFLGEVVVGYPTQCESLWGPDAAFVDRAAQVGTRLLRAADEYVACQRVHWELRQAALRNAYAAAAGAGAGGGGGAPMDDSPVAASASAPVHIFWASRKGDWARYVSNEDAVVAHLRGHVQQKYGAASSVQSLKLNGSLPAQIRAVHAATSIYVANHGANLLGTLYLRPNAGVVVLNLAAPGFYPFSVFPDWLHTRRMSIKQVCNPRLQPPKCVMSNPNNNDNSVTPEQLEALVAAVDSIVHEQRAHPLGPWRPPA